MGCQISSLQAKLPQGFTSITEDYKVARVTTVEENGKKTEIAYNRSGQVLRTSIFVDRNRDGQYDKSEAVSIKFNHVDSRACNTREYRDLDNDGRYDEIIESDWTGDERVQKFTTLDGSDNRKMSDAYGSASDTINEWF